MDFNGKMLHPASIMLLFLIVLAVILMIMTPGRLFFRGHSASKDDRPLALYAEKEAVLDAGGQADEGNETDPAAGSFFEKPVAESIDLTRFGVTGHNYYRLRSEGEEDVACISPCENRYLRLLKDTGTAGNCEIYNMCNLTMRGIHPGVAKLEYYSCNDSIFVGRKLPSYEELCEVYGEDSETIRELGSELLVSFRIVVDEGGKITFTEEKQ